MLHLLNQVQETSPTQIWYLSLQENRGPNILDTGQGEMVVANWSEKWDLCCICTMHEGCKDCRKVQRETWLRPIKDNIARIKSWIITLPMIEDDWHSIESCYISWQMQRLGSFILLKPMNISSLWTRYDLMGPSMTWITG